MKKAKEKGKHFFGVVKVGSKGQIVIPKKAREIFNITTEDQLVILGDEKKGIAIMKDELLNDFTKEILSGKEDD